MTPLELNELFLFTLSMMKKEADILPSNRNDMLRRGKMEAYSHCYLELKSLYDKWQQLVNTPEPEPELPSDEEIDTYITENIISERDREAFAKGAFWMRSQLKQKPANDI